MDHQQLSRIQLLSRRFLELQGLRVALAGGTLAIVLGGYMLATPPNHTGVSIAVLMAFLLMIPGELWLHQYYARTVGRQVPKPAKLWQTLVFFNVYFVIGMYLNRRFPEIPAGGPTMGIVVLYSLLVTIRDWPWRAHYLLVALAVVSAFVPNVVGVEEIDRGRTLAMTTFAGAVAFVIAGLLDHRLLMRLTAEARQPEAAAAVDS
jgi:hypothetical protein